MPDLLAIAYVIQEQQYSLAIDDATAPLRKLFDKWFRWPCRSPTDLRVICMSVSC